MELSASMDLPTEVNDVCQLYLAGAEQSCDTEKIASVLKARFASGKTHTYLSPACLISVNPNSSKQNTDGDLLSHYVCEQWQTEREGLAPHPYQLALRAFYYLRRTGQDQSIILSGRRGAGKSEAARQVMAALSEVAVPSAGKKGFKVVTQIPAAQFLLDTFGHAATLSNNNASHFGRYTEIQFNDKHRICGMKTLCYHLDASRVSVPPQGERNFRIFEYLLAGATKEEAAHLRLGSVASGGFLFASGQTYPARVPENAQYFEKLKEAFKCLGFPRRAVSSILQVVAAILHLGQLHFIGSSNRSSDAATVYNRDVLDHAAFLLGVDAMQLESALQIKTTVIGWSRTSRTLDADAIAENRNELAQALYRLLFQWVIDFVNSKLARDDFRGFISVLDFPGSRNTGSTARNNAINEFCFNSMNERLQGFLTHQAFELRKEEYETEGTSEHIPAFHLNYIGNADTLKLLTNIPGGLIHIMDDQTTRRGKSESTMLEAMERRWTKNRSFSCRLGDSSGTRAGSFTVEHFDGQTTYSTEDFLQANRAAVSSDFVALFAGQMKISDPSEIPSRSDFVRAGGSENQLIQEMFAREAAQAEEAAKNGGELKASSTLRAKPTIRRKAAHDSSETEDSVEDAQALVPKLLRKDTLGKTKNVDMRTVVGGLNEAMSLLLSTVANTRQWRIICLQSNDIGLPSQCDSRCIKAQINAYGLFDLARRFSVEWSVDFKHREMLDRYSKVEAVQELVGKYINAVWRDKLAGIQKDLGLGVAQMAIGTNKVYIDHSTFRYLEDELRQLSDSEQAEIRLRQRQEMERQAGVLPRSATSNFYSLDSPSRPELVSFDSTPNLPLVPNAGYAGSPELLASPSQSQFDLGNTPDSASTIFAPSAMLFTNMEKGKVEAEKQYFQPETLDADHTEVIRTSGKRRIWLAMTKMFTFWIPEIALIKFGRMKRADVRIAWREKLLINLLIWLLCGAAIFVIVFMGDLICPTQHVYTLAELQSHGYTSKQPLVGIRGEIFDLGKFATVHQPAIVPTHSVLKYAGQDATSLFPQQLNALCEGADAPIDRFVMLPTTNTTESNAVYHDFRYSTTVLDARPDWYQEQMIMMRAKYRTGFFGYTSRDVAKRTTIPSQRNTLIFEDAVYDMTTYIQNSGGVVTAPNGTNVSSGTNTQFMHPFIVTLFTDNAGQDVTRILNTLSLDASLLDSQKNCLRNLFFIGNVDHRGSMQCQFSRNILLALSCLIVAIIGVKFIAALNFASSKTPEDADKFVILQLPCYTENEDSLRRSLESLAALKYNDKHKLIFVICDGNIIGAGNDESTPDIVLRILGADVNADPEPLSFVSLGEGARQHNMGRVYSGLYEHAGRIVPYVVVVKVGKASERSKPGNRGKRDSQCLVMSFLHKVHYGLPMSPLELDLYHNIKNVIGINPSYYEFLLSIDADTYVERPALSRMIAHMMRDRRIIGLCGQTGLSNGKSSLVTSIQVFEYFISHFLAKAFESLFGSVTCLPGCFSLFRIKTVDQKPLLCSQKVIDGFAINIVDTLHLKNLLHLGEDRYLTTLLLREFPTYKTSFVRDAEAKTIAPEEFKVLLSQRRRWINSTVHNLFELVRVNGLCGFCCFSMRFIVFMDLLSTLVAPVTVVYVIYLIYSIAVKDEQVPTIAFIMLAAIYGMQAVIFILHGAFDMIGWLVLYILAIPIFSFFIPLYAFWNSDDFAWGSTRTVQGENGKRLVVHEEGKFDPSEIPLQTWSDYENELWEKGSNQSIGSIIAHGKRQKQADETSLYGAASIAASQMLGYGRPKKQSMTSIQALNNPFNNPSPYLSPTQSPLGLSPMGTPSVRATERKTDYALQTGGNRSQPHSPIHSLNLLALNTSPSAEDMPLSALRAQRSPPAVVAARGQLPSDSQLTEDVNSIVAGSDLSQITKRIVRKQLCQKYGVDSLGDKTQLANQLIEYAASEAATTTN